MTTSHKVQEGSGCIVLAKDAPDSILPVCKYEQRGDAVTELTEADRAHLWKTNDEMAGRALRVLALAHKRTQSADEEPFEGLTLLGMVGMIDPP